MRKLKRRKLNKILIRYVHGRNTRKPNSSPTWPKTSPKIPLQLKTKQEVEGEESQLWKVIVTQQTRVIMIQI